MLWIRSRLLRELIESVGMTTQPSRAKTILADRTRTGMFSVDPFKSLESQVEDAVKLLRPVIPLQFITVSLAFMVQGKDYGAVSQMLRDSIQNEEWMSNGNWACVVSVPGGMKNDIMDKVASRSPDVEVRELD